MSMFSMYFQLRIEFPLMPLNSTVNGTVIPIKYLVTSLNNEIIDETILYSAIKSSPSSSIMSIPIVTINPPMNNTPIILGVYRNITYEVNITTSESIMNFNFILNSTTANNQVTIAFASFQFDHIGYNYPCLMDNLPQLTLSSTDNSTATDQAMLTGVITNTGELKLCLHFHWFIQWFYCCREI